MVSATLKEATPPWYKQAWPWFLMGLPATAVVAGGITLWLAVSSNDGLVADDYYKQGLSVNKVIDRSEHAAQIGLSADLSLTAEQVQLRLLRSGGEAPRGAVVLRIFHPTRAGMDQELLLRGEDGVFSAPIKPLVAGRWDLTLEDESRNWRLNGAVHLPAETKVQMKPFANTPVD